MDTHTATSAPSAKHLTLGRGRVHIDGFYVHETPKVDFVSTPEGPAIDFETTTVSPENLRMFFDHMEGKRRVFSYVAHNPKGPQVDFKAEGTLHAVHFPLKGDGWQVLKFRLRFAVTDLTFVSEEAVR